VLDDPIASCVKRLTNWRKRPHSCQHQRSEARHHRTIITRKSENPPSYWGSGLMAELAILIRDLSLQRLYSTFARGGPGMGLLCLRLIAATAAIHYALSGLASEQSLLREVIESVVGLLLCAGLWTPIAGVVLAALALWSSLSATGDFWAQLLLAGVGAALALLGPGAWSIDARLFGRKRLIREP
jgi:putative oxidoreductase